MYLPGRAGSAAKGERGAHSTAARGKVAGKTRQVWRGQQASEARDGHSLLLPIDLVRVDLAHSLVEIFHFRDDPGRGQQFGA